MAFSLLFLGATRLQGALAVYRDQQILLPSGSTISFGSVEVDDPLGGAFTLTLRNTVNSPLFITHTAFTGDHASDFTLLAAPATELSAGTTTNLAIKFLPSASGARTAGLTITSNHPETQSGVYQLALSGTGIGDNPPANPANIITFGPLAPRQYGDEAFDLVATASSGLPVTLAVTGPATLGGADRKKLILTGAGTIKITATQRGGVRDGVAYPAARLVRQTLRVAKAPLTLTVADARTLRGKPLPAPVITYQGFIGLDSVSRLSSPPVRSTTASVNSPAGTYPFGLSVGTDPNYAITVVPATLRILDYSGDYEALLLTPDDHALPIAKLDLRVASAHKFTGKLADGAEGTLLTIKGSGAGLALDATTDDAIATATISAKPKGRPAFNYTLSLRFSALPPAAPVLSADLKLAEVSKARAHDGRLVFTKNKTYTAGKLTLVLAPPDPFDPEAPAPLPIPGGHGHATGTFSTAGKLTLSGTLADGAPLTATLLPDAAGRYRLFSLPYPKRPGSYLAGRIDPSAHPDLPAGHRHVPADSGLDLHWAKTAAPKDKAFRGGFGGSPLVVAFTLDPWLPPVKASTRPAPNGTPAVTLAQRLDLNPAGTFVPVFTATDFDPFGANPFHLPTALRLDSRDKILVTAPTSAIAAKPTFKFNASTGAFTGRLTIRQSLNGKTVSRTLKTTGVLRQPPSTEQASPVFGAGFFELSPSPKTSETRFEAFHFEHAPTANP